MRIEKNYLLPFPLEQIYAAWISSDTVIAPAKRMKIEPVIGGLYQLFMDANSTTPSMEGQFLEIMPNQQLRYTWEWHKEGNVSEVKVRFSPADNGTRVELSHSGFTTEQAAEMHSQGWDNYIEGLTKLLASK
ncbi:MAG: SRPBCC family protein [Rhizobiaceae bacterium]